MEPFVRILPAILEEQGGVIAGLDPEICLQAGIMDWEHRDPFDRFLAATAMKYELPLVSADTVFDGVTVRIW